VFPQPLGPFGFSRLFAAAAVSLMMGCASQSAPVSAPAQQAALLIGTESPAGRVLIKSVDNGPTLWASRGALGSKVTIRPGRHTIEVMCELEGHFLSGEVTLDVQPGQVYELSGSQAPGASKCSVSARSRS